MCIKQNKLTQMRITVVSIWFCFSTAVSLQCSSVPLPILKYSCCTSRPKGRRGLRQHLNLFFYSQRASTDHKHRYSSVADWFFSYSVVWHSCSWIERWSCFFFFFASLQILHCHRVLSDTLLPPSVPLHEVHTKYSVTRIWTSCRHLYKRLKITK